MLRKTFGVPVFYSDEKLLKHVHQNKDMGADNHLTTEPSNYTYNDEHYNGSKIAYDGSLIDASDASHRFKRDKARQMLYHYREDRLDGEQMTFEDVKHVLENPPSETPQLSKMEWRRL